jgi:hypothetical protein
MPQHIAPALVRNFSLLHRLSDALSDQKTTGEIKVRKDNQELFTAKSTNEISAAKLCTEHRSQPP